MALFCAITFQMLRPTLFAVVYCVVSWVLIKAQDTQGGESDDE